MSISVKEHSFHNGCNAFGQNVPLRALVPHAGIVNFRQTYENSVPSVSPLETRTIVLHGMMVNGEYSVGTPVTCGVIRAVPGLH